MSALATRQGMRVLVVYASRHGATAGIAERIAATLRRAGAAVTLQAAGEAGDPAGYDAIVVGSALYMFRWLREASAYVRRYRASLAGRPVWLFSSGPLDPAARDAQGRDQRAGAGPRDLAELQAAFQPRDHQVFFGAFDPGRKPVGLMERLIFLLPAARNGFPAGDFRDWDAIEAWATGIAGALLPASAAAA